MRKVAVIGVGCSKVGELWDKALKDLSTESSLRALDNAGMSKIDSIYVGNALALTLLNQGNIGTTVADSLGFRGTPAISVEASDASGGLAFHEAVKSVAAGWSDTVLVTGVEKMSDASPAQVAKALMSSEDQEYTAFTGVTVGGLHGLILRLYLTRFKVKHEDIAFFAVNAHKNAVNNPSAQFRNPLTVDDVLNSLLVADPLRLLESSSVADGAASVILCPLEKAKKFTDTPIEVLASTVATDSLNFVEHEDLLTFESTRISAQKAYAEGKISPPDIDLVETNDSSTIMGVIALEDLGFVEKGKGASLVKEGDIAIDGKLPTNTMGGSKGRGHPIGATGVYQLVEIVKQLRAEAGKNQVANAQIGLAHCVGGMGSYSVVNILRRS